MQFDGRDLLVADNVAPMGKGRVGLAAEWIRAELSDLAVAAGRPEFADSFDSLDAWRPSYGPDAWRVEADSSLRPGNRVAVFSAAADGAIVGDPQWSHFAAEVKGKFLDASKTWACFGLRPKLCDRGFYVVEVRGKQSRLSVWKQWQGRRDPAVAREVPLGRIETGRWYTLRCELVGAAIRVDFDGRRVLELVDPHPIPGGRTAISASYGTVQLDDFRQEELPSAYSFAKEERPREPYDPGPALERPAPVGPEDAAYWYLERPGLRAAVHRRSGMLGGLWLADGRRVLERSAHLYRIETRTSQSLADEYSDTVAEVVERSANGLRLRCVNSKMPGVSVQKHYCLQENLLVRRLAMTNEGKQTDLFATISERAVLDESFRREAIYTGGSYFGPLVPAKEIHQRVLTDAFKRPWTTGITNGRPSWILALNWPLDRHLASYRYRVNGQYVLPWNSIWTEGLDLYHTPAGWEMGLATLHLEPGRERSVEIHERAFRGGRLEFYNAYMDLPDVAAMYARVGPRPAWLRQLKMPISGVNEFSLAASDEGFLVWLGQPFGIWGDLPTSGKAQTSGGICTWPVERVRRQIEQVQAQSPRVKAGFYTWAWSAHHKSQAVAERPEWFIAKDRSGKVRNAYPLALSYLRCLSAPGCLEATLHNYRELVRFYGEDFQYLDNDGTGAQVIDWERLRLDQDYDWQRFHEGLLAAARARNPQTATFFNNRVLPQGDISYAEFMPAEIQNPQGRRPANEMYPLKVFQKRDPERVVALLYHRPENEPSYTNYCVGLGLVPWCEGRRLLPFVNAAFETRRLEVVEARLRPDWQRDLATELEAYTMRQGGAGVLFLVGHNETPAPVRIGFDVQPMGLEPGRPYFTWLFELHDPREHVGRLSERQQREAYQGSHWAEELVVAGRLLDHGRRLPARYDCDLIARPSRLKMLAVTHSPALVWSINGRRTNFWWPTVRGVDCRGWYDPAENRCEVDCRSEEQHAELVVWIPPGHELAEIRVDAHAACWQPECAGETWLARIAVPRGTHQIVARYRKRLPAADCPAELETPQKVVAGQPLHVRIHTGPQPLGRSLVRVLRDGVTVASAERAAIPGAKADPFELAVPETARPGPYELSCLPIGAVDRSSRARFEVVPGAWKPDSPGERQTGQPAVRVWPVNRMTHGIEVLNAGTDTFDHQGGVQIAELDEEKLSCRCGLSCDSESPWGYGFAGVEVRGVKRLAIELANTFSGPYQEGITSLLGDRYLDSMAGLMIDYHAPRGYTYRVALGLGVLHLGRPVAAPHWGKSARPDRCLAWNRTLLEKPQDRLVLDLDQFAPADWDGQAWISVGVDTVARGLLLQATIRPER